MVFCGEQKAGPFKLVFSAPVKSHREQNAVNGEELSTEWWRAPSCSAASCKEQKAGVLILTNHHEPPQIVLKIMVVCWSSAVHKLWFTSSAEKAKNYDKLASG